MAYSLVEVVHWEYSVHRLTCMSALWFVGHYLLHGAQKHAVHIRSMRYHPVLFIFTACVQLCADPYPIPCMYTTTLYHLRTVISSDYCHSSTVQYGRHIASSDYDCSVPDGCVQPEAQGSTPGGQTLQAYCCAQLGIHKPAGWLWSQKAVWGVYHLGVEWWGLYLPVRACVALHLCLPCMDDTCWT